MNDATPTPGHTILTPGPNQYGLAANLTPNKLQMLRWERELDERNRPYTDAELDQLLYQKGYEIVKPPEDYQPIRMPGRKMMSDQSPFQNTP